MKTSIQNTLIRNWMSLTVTLAVLVSSSRIDARPPTKQEVQQANELAKQLLNLDDAAKAEFTKDHPGVLPEGSQKLPKPTAIAFDWTNLNLVSGWHRQRNEDCWANSSTEALECSYLIRNDQRTVLSPQPILDHLKLGAQPNEMQGQPSIACDFFLKTGTARIANYPYNGKPQEPKEMPLTYRAVAWGYVSPDDKAPTTEQLKAALLSHGPLVVDLTDTKKFAAYQGGLFNEPAPIDKTEIKGKHAVLLVGWDDSRGAHGAWKIKNSWGPTWGEQGFMWIAYGSNDVCRHAEWVCAASIFYSLPSDSFASLVPSAQALPAIHFGELARKPKPAPLPSASVASITPTAPAANPGSAAAEKD